jgi:hypothetical protein
MKIKALIIMFNRLEWPEKMAQYLADTGCEVILVDNNSTYGPLLKWYETCPYTLIRLDRNFGHKAPWEAGIVSSFPDEHYIVTDHDLDLSRVPHDYTDVLFRGLEANPSVIKSGFSLEIGDLPVNNYTKRIIEWENQFWKNPVDSNGFFLSAIDTTFALYDKKREFTGFPDSEPLGFIRAVRSPRPYIARHLPWYMTKDNLTAEDLYFLDHCSNCSYWAKVFRDEFGIGS